MNATVKDRKQAESEVRKVLEETKSPCSPADLISRLEEQGFREGVIRTAMWYLIDRAEIRLTTDRKLEVRA